MLFTSEFFIVCKPQVNQKQQFWKMLYVESQHKNLQTQQLHHFLVFKIGPPKIIALPTARSSGSFPVVPKKPSPPPLANSPDIPQTSNETQTPANRTPENEREGNSSSYKWRIWVVICFCILLLIIIAISLWCVCRSHAVKTISPWRTGISGKLQKAFVTGNPLSDLYFKAYIGYDFGFASISF